jgi:hypothetical protein
VKYIKKRYTTKVKIQRKAIDVLYQKMMFYHEKAAPLYNRILDLLNEGANGALIVALNKDMHNYNKITIDCAKELAPFQTPRLQSVEVKSKHEHRFVIKVPTQNLETNQWLEHADKVIKSLPAPPTIREEETEIKNITNHYDTNAA